MYSNSYVTFYSYSYIIIHSFEQSHEINVSLKGQLKRYRYCEQTLMKTNVTD